MRLAQFELTAGRNTAIPDAGNWQNTKSHTIGGVDFKVGEYLGSDNSIASYTGVWPLSNTVYRTVVTGQELMNLFDKESPDIWMAIEGLTQTTAIEFRDMIGRRLKSPIDLNHIKMVSIFAQMVPAGIATQAQVDNIKLGMPV